MGAGCWLTAYNHLCCKNFGCKNGVNLFFSLENNSTYKTYKTTVESEGQSHLVDSQHKVRRMIPSKDGIKSRDRYATGLCEKNEFTWIKHNETYTVTFFFAETRQTVHRKQLFAEPWKVCKVERAHFSPEL